MLYYVKTGLIDTSLHATSHRQAAVKALSKSREECGVCVVVSDREIEEDNAHRNVYFLTESILEMRLVS